LTNFGGNVSLVKINEDGVVKNINVRLENLNYITQVTGSATPDCNFFFAWINGVENDSLGTGLYATFINPGDSVIIPKILISEVIDSVGIWEYVGNYTMKSIVLNDSTYKLFWLNNSTSMLYSIKLNINGEILSDIDSLLIPGSGHPYESVSKVVLTNKTEEGFYLFISSSYYDSNNDVYTNSFVKYNEEGEQIGDIMTEKTTSLFALNLFNLGAGNFFRASSDMKDVFLDQLEYFNLLASEKINDDESGSNQKNYKLTKYDDNSVFPIWNDEENYHGIMVDGNGNIIGDTIVLSNPNILFFPDKEFIATWIKSLNDSTHIAGYTIFDMNFNEKFSKTLFTSNTSYNLSIKVQIISDSSFIALLNSFCEIKLFKELKSGTTLKEKTISSGSVVYGEDIFLDDLTLPAESFWINWDQYLQKLSSDLEPLSEIKNFPLYTSSYLGQDRFLIIITEYDLYIINGVAYGTIVNSDMDTIKNRIPLSYFKSGSYNLFVNRLDDNEFLAINKYANKYYAKAYSNDGIATKDSFMINRHSTSFVSRMNYLVNNDKVFFTWSDARTIAKGYDIYGSIFNLSSITSVKEIISKIPHDFNLYQNYPNPFNPSTRIRFSIPEFSHVLIKIYDILGNEITTLVDEDHPSGGYEVSFDGSNLASGFYFYRITAGNYSETRKMILLK